MPSRQECFASETVQIRGHNPRTLQEEAVNAAIAGQDAKTEIEGHEFEIHLISHRRISRNPKLVQASGYVSNIVPILDDDECYYRIDMSQSGVFETIIDIDRGNNVGAVVDWIRNHPVVGIAAGPSGALIYTIGRVAPDPSSWESIFTTMIVPAIGKAVQDNYFD